MKFMNTENTKPSSGIYAVLLLALAAGIFGGSVYLARGWGEMGEGIAAYLSDFFSSFAENESQGAVFKTSLASNLLTLGFIFIMGFFRFGALGTGAVIIRRGFIMGFTAASFIKAYGMRGMLIMLSTMPSVLIYIPAMLIFSAVSVGFSRRENKFQKKIIFSYIFFTIIAVSIFCAASFAEGFLTTTFMKLISPNLT